MKIVRPWARVDTWGNTPAAAAGARGAMLPREGDDSGDADRAAAPAAGPRGARPQATGSMPLGAASSGSSGAEAAVPVDECWSALIDVARRLYASADFATREVHPALAAAEHLQRARGALLAGARSWGPLLARALNAPGVPVSRTVRERFSRWYTAQREPAAAALRALWAEAPIVAGDDDAITARLSAFLECLPANIATGTATRAGLASALLAALDPTRYPPYYAGLERAYALAGFPRPPRSAEAGSLYAHALAFLDELAAQAAARGLALGNRLIAAAIARRLARCAAGHDLPEGLDRAALERLGRLAASTSVTSVTGVTGVGSAGRRRAPPYATLEALASALLFEPADLARIERLLADKGQCIFYGPPGTGKTFVARELARFLAGSDERVEVVQLHPSYAYEDFVEGYRPRLIGGQPGFELVDGPLKRIAQAALRAPHARHVLVIDELNRGQVAKVFGELYYLLEYRGESIVLQYSGLPFALPRNLWIIGTMNTADRSIALVDLALRRRFYFVPFFPDEPPVEGLLRRWLARHAPDLSWLADVVDRANELLRDRHTAIGPSYFLKPGLTEEWVELIWEHGVLPYLAEQLYGEEERLRELALDQLRHPPGGRARPASRRPYVERPAQVAEARATYRTRRAPSGRGGEAG
jgi:5-methylcytosine-specific restriction protein B